MSFKAVQWAFDQTVTHTATDKLVLICLAYHASDKGEAWPGLQTLVTETLLSERTVRYSLRSLQSLGLILVEHRHRKKGSVPTSSLYKLKMNRHVVPHPPASHAPPTGTWCPTILEPQGEPLVEQDQIASDQTVDAPSDFSNWKAEVEEDLPTQSHPNFEVWVKGLFPTPEMKAAGITGIVFETQAELEEHGPALGVPVDTDEIAFMYQKSLTPEQAVLKAKNGKKSYTSSGLKVLWKDLITTQNPGVFQAPITEKAKGQFGHLNKKMVGVDVGWLMHDAILDWVRFGKYLKGQGVVHDFPDKPEVGFFLKHAELAVGFSKKQHEAPKAGGMKPFDPNE